MDRNKSTGRKIDALLKEIERALERLSPRFDAHFHDLDVHVIGVNGEHVVTGIKVEVIHGDTEHVGSISLTEAAGLAPDLIAAYLLGAGIARCQDRH